MPNSRTSVLKMPGRGRNAAMWLMFAAVAAPLPAAAQVKTATPQRPVTLNFELRDLTEPLRNLTPEDRLAVDQAIRAIGQKDHVVALSYLTKLSATNPMNSSLKVLRAFALLELGNLSGA